MITTLPCRIVALVCSSAEPVAWSEIVSHCAGLYESPGMELRDALQDAIDSGAISRTRLPDGSVNVFQEEYENTYIQPEAGK